MTKSKTAKKEKMSVASEIDRMEERKLHCKNNLERAEFRQRKEQLSDHDRQALEDEMTVMNERIQKYEDDLQMLRGENRRNMMLSVALLAISSFLLHIHTLKRIILLNILTENELWGFEIQSKP